MVGLNHCGKESAIAIIDDSRECGLLVFTGKIAGCHGLAAEESDTIVVGCPEIKDRDVAAVAFGLSRDTSDKQLVYKPVSCKAVADLEGADLFKGFAFVDKFYAVAHTRILLLVRHAYGIAVLEHPRVGRGWQLFDIAFDVQIAVGD